ncbi:MAG: class I SAM-dependent methyltransferase [Chloroflexi bacterium]|nr:class I SAM-dependent methyltransferase [Chloroflexota bacterium]
MSEGPRWTRWSSGDEDAIRRGRALRRLLDRHGRSAARIVDIGCGEGGVAEGLATSGFVAGCEPHLRLLERATAAGDRATRIRFVAGDATRLPFVSGSFDAAVLYDVLEHVDAWPQALREAARVVRPGGSVVITAANTRSPITVLDDPHWHLPFVAIAPPALGRWLVRLARGHVLDMAGGFPVFPSWADMHRVFQHAGLVPTLVGIADKISDPEAIISPRKRELARWLRARKLPRAFHGLRAQYDRHIARGWLFLLERRSDL